MRFAHGTRVLHLDVGSAGRALGINRVIEAIHPACLVPSSEPAATPGGLGWGATRGGTERMAMDIPDPSASLTRPHGNPAIQFPILGLCQSLLANRR